jgi:hypothetical protein
MKTSELTGAALDWAAAKANGIPADEIYISGHGKYQSLFRKNRDEDGNLDGSYTTGPGLLFSTKWETGGPIIEREWDSILRWFYLRAQKENGDMWPDYMLEGKPVLQAFMQAYVASKLGDEVEIPKELK